MSEYLAIKNWKKYQSLRGGGKWIKDYTEQADDEAMSKLSLFQRMVLQGIRRLCGKLGRNVPNDVRYICNAMNALRTDRPRVKDAIDTLIEQHWLTVMGSPELVSESGEIREKRIEKREEPKPSASPKARGVKSQAGQRSDAAAQTRHSRVQQLVVGWYGDWAGAECPWDGGEAKNLSRMLKSTPNWPDQQFLTCLDNLARSDCVAKGTRPREWIEGLPKFLRGPLDRFWKPMGAGTNGAGTSKNIDRINRNRAVLVSQREVGSDHPHVGSHGTATQPGPHAGTGVVLEGSLGRSVAKPNP